MFNILNPLPRFTLVKGPKFRHDCERCTYLGTAKATNLIWNKHNKVADLYRCGDTLLARYSSKGGDYSTGHDIIANKFTANGTSCHFHNAVAGILAGLTVMDDEFPQRYRKLETAIAQSVNGEKRNDHDIMFCEGLNGAETLQNIINVCISCPSLSTKCRGWHNVWWGNNGAMGVDSLSILLGDEKDEFYRLGLTSDD